MKREDYLGLDQLDRIEYNQLRKEIAFSSLTISLVYIIFSVFILLSILSLLLYQVTGNIEVLKLITSMATIFKPVILVSIGLDLIMAFGCMRRSRKLDKEFLNVPPA